MTNTNSDETITTIHRTETTTTWSKLVTELRQLTETLERAAQSEIAVASLTPENIIQIQRTFYELAKQIGDTSHIIHKTKPKPKHTTTAKPPSSASVIHNAARYTERRFQLRKPTTHQIKDGNRNPRRRII